jgi:hypothetical protein
MATTAGHRLTLDPMGKYSNAFFSETTNMIKAKLYMNVQEQKMEFFISETNKEKKSLIYDSYTFRVDRVLKNSEISRRCTKNSCKCRIRTDVHEVNGVEIFRKNRFERF